MIKRIKHIIIDLYESKRLLNEIQSRIVSLQYSNSEILFSQYFRDSITDSQWVKDKSFSAYGGAANYSLLYKLYKIYDLIEPEHILEFGLGQTTKLSSQYARSHKNSTVTVVDDDKAWIEIYEKQTSFSKNVKIKYLELQDFKHDGRILQSKSEYANLESIVGSTKYNLIVVDGPIGYDKEYPRTNVLKLINNLSSDWIVIFDDAERPGETRTINLFREELNKHGATFEEFRVSGSKTQQYFCSTSLYKSLYAI